MERVLNAYESFLWLLGRTEPFLIQWTLMLNKASIEPEAVRIALKLLQQQHPLLNTTITAASPYCYKNIQKPIRLTVHPHKTKQDWETIALKAINKPLPLAEDETFLTVDWVKAEQEHEFILTLDHSVSDLRCLVGLGCDFLQLLDEVCGGKKDIKIKFYPELPPIHTLLPTEKPAAIAEPLQVGFADSSTPLLAEPPYDYKLPYVIQFSEKETQHLIENIRDHNCTVHSVFCAAMMYTLNNFLLEKNAVKESFCFTPADLRSYLNADISGKDMGNFAADVFHPFKVGELPDFWTLAKNVRAQVNYAFETDAIEKAKQGIAALFQDGADIKEMIKGLKIRDACTAVGNVGVIPMLAHFKHFTLHNTQFGSGSSIISGRGYVFWLRIATLYGKMQLEFLRTNPYEYLDVVPDFAKSVVDLLKKEGIISR